MGQEKGDCVMNVFHGVMVPFCFLTVFFLFQSTAMHENNNCSEKVIAPGWPVKMPDTKTLSSRFKEASLTDFIRVTNIINKLGTTKKLIRLRYALCIVIAVDKALQLYFNFCDSTNCTDSALEALKKRDLIIQLFLRDHPQELESLEKFSTIGKQISESDLLKLIDTYRKNAPQDCELFLQNIKQGMEHKEQAKKRKREERELKQIELSHKKNKKTNCCCIIL